MSSFLTGDNTKTSYEIDSKRKTLPGLCQGGGHPIRWTKAAELTRTQKGAMKIYGISQTSGVERRLYVESGSSGVVLIICDHIGNKERQRILVPTDDLLASLTDPPAGGSTVDGIAPPNGPAMQLTVDVRRNEVLLAASGGKEEGADVAVGLDDFQDALEGVMNRA
jgi:hypothetical protein